MAKKLAGIYRCRNCGFVLTDKAEKMSPTTEWMLREMFKDGDEYAPIRGGSAMGEGLNLLHRCDPERFCVCDLIGWKVEEEAQDDGK